MKIENENLKVENENLLKKGLKKNQLKSVSAMKNNPEKVELYFDDVYRDETLQGPNPKSFEPFRHVNTNVTTSKVTRNFVMFGGGKHE